MRTGPEAPFPVRFQPRKASDPGVSAPFTRSVHPKPVAAWETIVCAGLLGFGVERLLPVRIDRLGDGAEIVEE